MVLVLLQPLESVDGGSGGLSSSRFIGWIMLGRIYVLLELTYISIIPYHLRPKFGMLRSKRVERSSLAEMLNAYIENI